MTFFPRRAASTCERPEVPGSCGWGSGPSRCSNHCSSICTQRSGPDRDSYEMRSDARRFEQFEASVAGRLGLGVACRYAVDLGVGRTWQRVSGLGEQLRERLESIDGVAVHDKGVVRGGIVTFTVDGHPAGEVSHHLRTAGINTSVTARSSAMFDLPDRGLGDLVRASVHYYNTEVEVGLLVDHVGRVQRGPVSSPRT